MELDDLVLFAGALFCTMMVFFLGMVCSEILSVHMWLGAGFAISMSAILAIASMPERSMDIDESRKQSIKVKVLFWVVVAGLLIISVPLSEVVAQSGIAARPLTRFLLAPLLVWGACMLARSYSDIR